MVPTGIPIRILVHPSKLWIHIIQTLSPQRSEPLLDKTELSSRRPFLSYQRQIIPITGRTHPPLTQAQTHHPPTRVPIFLPTKLTSLLPYRQIVQPPHKNQRTIGYRPIHHLILVLGTHHLFKSLKQQSSLFDNYNHLKTKTKTIDPVHQYLTPKFSLRSKLLCPLNNAHHQDPPPEEQRAPDAAHEPWGLATSTPAWKCQPKSPALPCVTAAALTSISRNRSSVRGKAMNVLC